MKYAWVENNVVRDICAGNPAELFAAPIAAYYTTVIADTVERGARFTSNMWVNPDPIVVPAPVVPEPEPVGYPTVSAIEYKMLFTTPERIAIKTSTDPIVMDIYELLNDPRVTNVNMNLQSVQDALSYFVTKGLLTNERVAVILQGVVT